MVSQYSISGGRIDRLGIDTELADVIPFLPLYIVQAMIASLSFIFMLALPYAALLAYAGKAQSTLWGRLAGYAAGSVHFFAHIAAMFCLALFVVSFNNSVAPAVERQLDAIYSQRQQQAPLVRDVIQESLEPLQRRQRPVVAQQPASPSAVREIVGFILYPILMIGIGMFLGGFVTGLYLTITSFFCPTFRASRIRGARHRRISQLLAHAVRANGRHHLCRWIATHRHDVESVGQSSTGGRACPGRTAAHTCRTADPH